VVGQLKRLDKCFDLGDKSRIASFVLVSLLNDRTFNEAESSKAQETCHKNGDNADPGRNVPAVDYHVPLEDEPQ
jgi:hypothetical protein